MAQKQFNNTLKLTTNAFYIPERAGGYDLTRQVGLSYEHRVYKKISLQISYHQWRERNSDHFATLVDEPIHQQYYMIPIGALHSRISYRMIDLTPQYDINLSKRSKVKVGIGASYCWGLNAYVTWFTRNRNFPYDTQLKTEKEKANYWGIVPQISYDYSFWKGRLSVGIDARARYYSGRPQHQYDYGMHIGFNF